MKLRGSLPETQSTTDQAGGGGTPRFAVALAAPDLRPWLGGNDPTQVAPPETVLDLLRLSATMLQAQQQAQGTLLRRLMGG